MSRSKLATSALVALAGVAALAPTAAAGPRGGHHYHGGGGYRGGSYCGPSSGVSIRIGYSSGWRGSCYTPRYDPCYTRSSCVSSWVIAEPAYVRPYWTTPRYVAPVVTTPVYVEQPVYTTAPRVITTTTTVASAAPAAAPVTVQAQPAYSTNYSQGSYATTAVSSPAYATTTAQATPIVVSAQPGPAYADARVAVASAPAAPATAVNSVPEDLKMSAFRSGTTVVVAITGSNPAVGYATTLSMKDTSETSPALMLRNTAPTAGSISVATPFTLNASIKASGTVTSIPVWIGDQLYQVPVTEVTPIS